jgi:hypothetical protein
MDASNTTDLIYKAIELLNEELAEYLRLQKSVETELLKLDSMQLINLLVFVDSAIKNQTGVSLCLTEDAELLEETGPLRSVGLFASYLEMKLRQRPISKRESGARTAEGR